MARNQGQILEDLEQIVANLKSETFIYQFMEAFGFPKNTITRLRNSQDGRNVAEVGDIALKKKLYFKAVEKGRDVRACAEALHTTNKVIQNEIRFVIVTDFSTLVAFDLKADEQLEITVTDLPLHYAFFLPLAGYEKAILYSEHPADVKASEKMGQLFDVIKERNHFATVDEIHALNVFLTRLLFCFYAEDTGVFKDSGQMTLALKSCTKVDGSDVQDFFGDLFKVLNLKPKSASRLQMPAHFQSFPYVNGGLFKAETLVPEFNQKSRRILIECGQLDWSKINPDIFGSMFQAVIDKDHRSNFGQHYTSVSNILKVIQPLFLDKLQTELEKSSKSKTKLQAFLARIQSLRVFDPACGSGNFLIIAYKELRKLEMAAFKALDDLSEQSEMFMTGIRLSQFYGIELDDFAHEIALLALWLTEHQMNQEFRAEFGYTEPSLPLRDAGHIVCDNSLLVDWNDVCPKKDMDGQEYEIYICGNPPFAGKKEQTVQQKKEINLIFDGVKNASVLDYVCCWYRKSADYIVNQRNSRTAFVSTNSITQGEQVDVLWSDLIEKGVKINFAHRTFEWKNDAKNNAAVHCVIIGFSMSECETKKIYDYLNFKSDPFVITAENINPYLVDAPNITVKSRSTALCDSPKMIKGNEATDDGHLILSKDEMDQLILNEPKLKKWIRPFLGNNDFLNGGMRWCLWLEGITNEELTTLSILKERINKVRTFRLNSPKQATINKSETPWLFGENRQPKSGQFIIVPKVSAERRQYAPVAFSDVKYVVNNTIQFIPNADLYHFGMVQSAMHMAWLNAVGGRMKSDYQYSISLVYNTFPWPEITDAQRNKIEQLAEEVILIREDYPDKSLADLYDPDLMPEPLKEAHRALDIAIERLYQVKPFRDLSEKLEHLFARYDSLIKAEQNQVNIKNKIKSKRSN